VRVFPLKKKRKKKKKKKKEEELKAKGLSHPSSFWP
jgi:hypothetical protein